MFLFKKIGVFFVLLASIFSLSCSSLGFLKTISGEEESKHSSWEKNIELREKIKDREVNYENNMELLGKSEYTSQDFQAIYTNKDFFSKPKNPNSKFNFLEKYDKLSHNTTYDIDDLYEYAASFANAILENDDNILAWKTPSYEIESRNFKYDSEINTQKAIVHLQGGPVGDVSENGLRTSAYIYGDFGSVFYLNEAQYGLIPQQYVYNNEDYYLGLSFDNDVKHKIKNKNLDEIESFKILEENIDFHLNATEALLATSMALTKIEADKLALLGKKLKNEYNYQKVYMGGISHGFTIGVDALLNNLDNLPINGIYNSVIVENNMLMPSQENSERMSGGIMYKEDEKDFKGNTGTVNILLRFVRTLVKDIYGQKDNLQKLLNDNPVAKDNIYFKISLNDFNVGNPTEEELKFYYQNELNFTIKYKGGHNSLFSKEEYQKMFS